MCASVFLSLTSIKTAVAQNDAEVAQLNDSSEIISGAGRAAERACAASSPAATSPSWRRSPRSTKLIRPRVATLAKLAPEDAELIGKVKAAADAANAEEDAQVVAKPRSRQARRGGGQLAKIGRLTDTRALAEDLQRPGEAAAEAARRGAGQEPGLSHDCC